MGTFTGEDAAGYRVAAGSIDGDGVIDVLVSSSHADTTWVFAGPLVGPARDADAAAVALPGGSAGLGLGDFDGDGVQDVAAGSQGLWSETTTRVWTGGRLDPAAPAAQLVHLGEFAYPLVAGGDLDGDGIDELLIGGITACPIPGWDETGCAEVFTGPIEGVFDDSAVSTMIVAEPSVTLPAFHSPGRALDASNDLTGDGLRDIALLDSIAFYGKFYVLESPLPAVASLTDAFASLVPPEHPDWHIPPATTDVATGDLDGDGYADLVLTTASVLYESPGLAWVFSGPIPAGPLDTAAAFVTIEVGEQFTGDVVNVLGDFDGSGRPDLAVEGLDASQPIDPAASYVMVYYDPVGFAEPDLVLHDGEFGPNTIVAPGDVDGDGLADLITGSVGVLDSSGTSAGGAYLILGAATGY